MKLNDMSPEPEKNVEIAVATFKAELIVNLLNKTIFSHKIVGRFYERERTRSDPAKRQPCDKQASAYNRPPLNSPL